jgi:hypothetical protein
MSNGANLSDLSVVLIIVVPVILALLLAWEHWRKNDGPY